MIMLGNCPITCHHSAEKQGGCLGCIVVRGEEVTGTPFLTFKHDIFPS